MTEHQVHRPRHGRLALALASGLAVVAGLIGFSQPSAHAATQTKYYTAAASAQTLYAGLPGTVTVTVTNQPYSTQSFGSLQLNFGSSPVTGTTATAVDQLGHPWTESQPSTSPLVIQLASGSNPGILPGQKLVITVHLTASAAGTFPIGIEVKQSNDFSGHGNDFINQSLTPLSFTVNALSLVFTQEPTDVGQWTTSNPVYMCPPVKVSLETATGDQVKVAGVAIYINYTGANPGLYFNGAQVPPPPSSGVSVSTDASGTATFGSSACSSTQPASTGLGGSIIGSGYQLKATSPAASSATSTTFSVVCENNCSTGTLTSTSTGTTATVQATGTGSYVLFGSFGTGQLNCDNLVTTPSISADPLKVAVTSFSGMVSPYIVATMTFTKTVVNNLTNNGTSQMPVCAGATQPFPTLSAVQGSTTYPYQGLLPNCTSSYLGSDQFCVVSRNRNPGAGETVVVYVGPSYASDPSFW